MTTFLKVQAGGDGSYKSPQILGGTGRRIEAPGKNVRFCQVLVAHAYNPSYSGGRDQEDHGLKPAQVNTL
jgi:hypothetical protein